MAIFSVIKVIKMSLTTPNTVDAITYLSLGNTDSRSKASKMVTIKDKIEKHDLTSKLNNIKKWLAKGHTVRATITNLSKDEKKVVLVIFQILLCKYLIIYLLYRNNFIMT